MKLGVGINIALLTFLVGNALIKHEYDNPFRNTLIILLCLMILVYFKGKRLSK